MVTDLADPSANIIFGAVVDEKYDGQLLVTIIATGFAAPMQMTLGQQRSIPVPAQAADAALPWQRSRGPSGPPRPAPMVPEGLRQRQSGVKKPSP